MDATSHTEQITGGGSPSMQSAHVAASTPAPAPSADAAALMTSYQAYLDALLGAGLLISTGVDGLYGRSAVFESIVDGLNAAISALGADLNAESMRFPPAMSRTELEASEYMANFPQLAGTIHSFCGSDRDHQRLLARMSDGEEWADQQRPTRIALTPAACYPLYPVVARRGPVPASGLVFDLFSYCFRHEPSIDPARMQMFRQREFVCVGTEDQVIAFRERLIGRSYQLCESLQLPHGLDVANDPFFGRGGRIVADGQREQKLKYEMLIPIHAGTPGTACMSFNYHKDHFAHVWPLRGEGAELPHTGCCGFGIERMTLALLRHHGLDPAKWPAGVRETLELPHV
jgi:seryl-tRNA synthetase